MATGDDWMNADKAIGDLASGFQYRHGSQAAREGFGELSDEALEVAVLLTWKLHLAASSVLTTRKGHQAVLDALAD